MQAAFGAEYSLVGDYFTLHGILGDLFLQVATVLHPVFYEGKNDRATDWFLPYRLIIAAANLEVFFMAQELREEHAHNKMRIVPRFPDDINRLKFTPTERSSASASTTNH
jgi:hypothetical protein